MAEEAVWIMAPPAAAQAREKVVLALEAALAKVVQIAAAGADPAKAPAAAAKDDN
jgi:hypothetical protein